MSNTELSESVYALLKAAGELSAAQAALGLGICGRLL